MSDGVEMSGIGNSQRQKVEWFVPRSGEKEGMESDRAQLNTGFLGGVE